MCKYHLSQEQPYVQELICGQPEQVLNVNNEFSHVTAVSIDTRGIWLCSVKQQGKGIRKDTFYGEKGEAKSLRNSWTPSCLQQAPQLSTLLYPFAGDSTKSSWLVSSILGLRAGAQCCWSWVPAPPACRCSAVMALPLLCCLLPFKMGFKLISFFTCRKARGYV